MVKHQVLLLSFNFRCWHMQCGCYCWYFWFPQVYTNWKFPSNSSFHVNFFFFCLNSFWIPTRNIISTLTRCCIFYICEFSLMQFMIISSVIDNVLCLPHIAHLQETTQIERERLIHGATELFQCKSKWCAAWDDELCLLREAGMCLCVSHKCDIIIEFVYCSRVCLRYQASRLIYIIYARFTSHDVVDDYTQFLHSSIIIEACKVDTLINRNAMHILYFIITSFAYVGNIFYRYALLCNMLFPHTQLISHPFRNFMSIKMKFHICDIS